MKSLVQVIKEHNAAVELTEMGLGDKIGKLFKTKDKKEIDGLANLLNMTDIKVLQAMQKQNPKGFKRMTAKMGELPAMGEETTLEEAPKMKGLSIYGSEVSGLKRTDNGKGRSTLQYSSMSTYTAKPVVLKGKLAFRVEDTQGAFETLDLLSFAKMYG